MEPPAEWFGIFVSFALVVALVFVVMIFLLLQLPGVRGATPAIDAVLP